MKSVLVTGASGFIGRHVLPLLVKKDYQVHALFSAGLPIVVDPQIHWHQLNLHDYHTVDSLLQKIKPSHLLHLAWYAKPVEYWTSLHNLTWLNSSINLLNQFIQVGGKRAVFAGSCAEYDWQHEHCKEFFTPCAPQTLYGVAKRALNLFGEAIAQQQNLSFSWARLFFLMGAGEYKQRLVPSSICNLLQRQEFNVKNGRQLRDFICVTQAADALTTLLDTDVTGPVNIASGQPIRIKELITLIAKKLNAEHLVRYQEPSTISKEQDEIVTADVTRLLTEVKWLPQYSIDTALDKAIAWWSAQING